MQHNKYLEFWHLKKKGTEYFFLLLLCCLFEGLASLTGLIVFIAAVNSAVDNKLTMNKSKEEAPFNYNYGFSFFFAVMSFLSQELNGICNIYWYVDYYRKYKYDPATKSRQPQLPQPPPLLLAPSSPGFQIPKIKVNDVSTDELMSQPNRSTVKLPVTHKQSSGSSSGAFSIGFFGRPKEAYQKPQFSNQVIHGINEFLNKDRRIFLILNEFDCYFKV